MSDGPDWVEQTRRLVAGLGRTVGQALQEARATPADHPADCRWCPVCQAAAVVRGERPEVTAALADVLGAAASALRAFAESGPAGGRPAWGGQPASEQPGSEQPASEQPAAPAEPAPTVQRIEIV
ncbi:hypothetical protein DQ238_04730 [Geodermatophilus sp. TF02-6]|uniref:hypothetical protein n=1 Tax=Geodermatophilus sp. TF02-6 TaxID=2250575 RepID=UPI000DEBFE81|nr:hypothetical protein [Geodermatophilus sp. TF02-6]RBY82586.1 hypothetical protein DQ238_04730 [Geodermatophilus sp. TF02-6]